MVDTEERKLKEREDAVHEQEEDHAKSGKLQHKKKEHHNMKEHHDTKENHDKKEQGNKDSEGKEKKK